MRWICLAAILAVSTTAQAAEIRVISPGVISNSGLTEVAAAFEKKTGVKVTILVDGMGTIMNDIRTKDPAADVVMLPMDLMGTMVLSGAVSRLHAAGPGRDRAVQEARCAPPRHHHGAEADRGAEGRLQRALFRSGVGQHAGGHERPAAQAPRLRRRQWRAGQGRCRARLKRGEGDANALGLGLIHVAHNPTNTETGSPWLVGELPAELGMHMDMATGISTRSRRQDQCRRLHQVRHLARDAGCVEGQGHCPLLNFKEE